MEYSPDVAYTYGNKWEAKVIGYKEYSYPLSFSCKWLDGKQTTKSIIDYRSERAFAKDLWVFFDSADLIVGWNSDKYDIRKINTLFAKHGLGPASPSKSIDLIKTARSKFLLPSNTLDDFLRYFGLDMKLENEKDLFIKCTEKVPGSFPKLKKYNAHDTLVTEKAFKFLRPWIKNLELGIYNDGSVCPKCEGRNLEKRGFSFNKTTKYQRVKCKDCGSWSRLSINLSEVKPLISV